MRYRIFDRNKGLAKSILFNVSKDQEQNLEAIANHILGSSGVRAGQGDFIVQYQEDGTWVDTAIEIDRPIKG